MLKKSVSFCLSFVLLLGVMFCLPVSASAEMYEGTEKTFGYYFDARKTKNAVVYKSTDSYTKTIVYPDGEYSDNCKITNLKSNRSGVWLRKFGNSFTINSQSFTGTAKITYKLNGKTQTFKYTVKKYVNPCKSFKVGSTEYAKKYNSTNQIYSFRNIKNQKLKIQANSGWIITDVITYSYRYSKDPVFNYYSPYKSSFSKSNLTLLNNGWSYVYVFFKNTSTGAENVLLYQVR